MELAEEERKLLEMEMTQEEVNAMEEYDELTVMLRDSVNAAKRQAQKRVAAMTAWMEEQTGARYKYLHRIWPVYHATRENVSRLKREIVADPSVDVWPSLRALVAMGFLEEPVESLKLTPLGTMATEVNEGHAILMAQAYQKGILKNLAPEEILAVLVGFAEESGREMPAVDSLRVSKPVIIALWNIHDLAMDNQQLENKMGAPRAPRDSYWELNTTWVEPVWRWLQGATTQELCTDYECYEGNLVRLLSKVVNLLEEWRSLATLAKDTEMLEKMRGLETTIMRDLAFSDSLYLRL